MWLGAMDERIATVRRIAIGNLKSLPLTDLSDAAGHLRH